ncbi:uncharacterized protein LOC111702656 [Eurytemora carolleeae]|uniref:uncharacterized protein LOC111702656 n=1 Tax=Eurytemora carolleeae TaxID=1294199 RepID=UPI000C76AEFA|nr:uncharacterized protein LOC111702656 [Eurytemora carolleeae]|eukprot:XP_023330179.1 uncharacterized protein LOC111702656 [Eurytemora affinis]
MIRSLIPLSILIIYTQAECPFSSSACPVDLDNVVDVFYFDILDTSSCQHQCQRISSCSHFTMLTSADNKHNKCFLFKSCDNQENCDDCVSGAEEPPFYECRETGLSSQYKPRAERHEDNAPYTCTTDVVNVVDVYYFDQDDDVSCPHQCGALPECNYWSQLVVSDPVHPHNKCFLFNSCDTQEACTNCVTGSA